MKNTSILSILAMFACWALVGCTQQEKVDITAEKAKVKIVIDQFEEFWETEDLNVLANIMSHDANMVSYGSDINEIFVGWQALKDSVQKMLPAYENIKLTVRNQAITVHPSGNVAWFSQLWDWDLVYSGEHVEVTNLRLTGVLEKQNGNWVIVQFHNSVPVIP